MDSSLEEVKPVIVEKPKRQRKPKAVKTLEPVVEPVVEPEPSPEPLPEPEPEHEPVFACDLCGEPVVFTDEEMDIYRRINAHKRKQLRLKKSAVVSV